MKISRILTPLVICIAALACIAAGTGAIWQGTGTHPDFTTTHGQIVPLQGHGLYTYDSAATAAQAIAQDFVTLLVGVPLLVIALVLARQNILRGKLLLSGTLAYFLYAYMSYTFGSAYNPLFLVYVAIFSLSLFALIFSLMSINIRTLPDHISRTLPRKTIITYCFAVSTFLLLAWLGRIVPGLIQDTPPAGLDNSTTLFIQAMDLGLIVPLGYVTGILLLRRTAWGYVLAALMLTFGLSMSLALCAMLIGQILTGIDIAVVEAIGFCGIAMTCLVLTAVFLKHVSERAVPYTDAFVMHR